VIYVYFGGLVLVVALFLGGAYLLITTIATGGKGSAQFEQDQEAQYMAYIERQRRKAAKASL
jgi:hypothetical protein